MEPKNHEGDSDENDNGPSSLTMESGIVFC